MNRYRLYDVRTSGLPEAIGECPANIARIASITNEAQQRLLMDPTAPEEGFWGGWARYLFTVSYPNATIVTPREVARVVSWDLCKTPVRIRNEFYEFLEYTKGLQPEGCSSTCANQYTQAYERETVPIITPIVGTKIIRIYPNDSRDVGKRVLVQGKDANGKIVYGTSVLTGSRIIGETVAIDSPFSDAANQYTLINGLQKDPTMGEVNVYMVDVDTGEETLIATMYPSELTTQYRQYFLNGINRSCCSDTDQQLTALCKLDFVPVVADSDYLLIQNVPALIEEAMAVRYSRMDTPGSAQLAQARHAQALRLLNGQLDHFLGKTRPAIGRSIFGGNPLQRQPV